MEQIHRYRFRISFRPKGNQLFITIFAYLRISRYLSLLLQTMEKAIQNIKELEDMNIKRLLWKYFLPAFTGVVVNALYNIVDRIFIGRGVDALALSGLSAVFPLMLIIFAFGMLVAIGANVRISINMGKKDYKRAEWVLGNAVTLGIIISALLTLFGYIYRYPLLENVRSRSGSFTLCAGIFRIYSFCQCICYYRIYFE